LVNIVLDQAFVINIIGGIPSLIMLSRSITSINCLAMII